MNAYHTQLLDEFVKGHELDRKSGISIVTEQELSQLRSNECTVEDLLDHLAKHYSSLLHGSRFEIDDGCIKGIGYPEVYAANNAGVALMKAIISHNRLKSPGIVCPNFLDQEHPLTIHVYGMNDRTIGERGFVYVINSREGFLNQPKGSWQFIKNGPAQFSARIAVCKEDFNYLIHDVTNGRYF